MASESLKLLPQVISFKVKTPKTVDNIKLREDFHSLIVKLYPEKYSSFFAIRVGKTDFFVAHPEIDMNTMVALR